MYEMMRTGTTAFVDSYLLEANVLQEAERMGMRCVGGEVSFAFPSPAYGGWDGAEDVYKRQAWDRSDYMSENNYVAKDEWQGSPCNLPAHNRTIPQRNLWYNRNYCINLC